MSVLRRAKLRTPDGTESIEYPLGVEAENVEVANQENLSQRLVRIDEDLEKNKEDIAAVSEIARTNKQNIGANEIRIDDLERRSISVDKKPYYFNTVADMKTYQGLVEGDMVITLGYHNINDGGSAIYKIRTITNNDVIDEMTILSMNTSQNLIAELVFDSNINILQLGAYGDGIHDDTLYFNKLIALTNKINLPARKYLINTPINLISELKIKGYNSEIVQNNNYMFTLNNNTIWNCEISDLKITGNNNANSICFIGNQNFRNGRLTNLRISNFYKIFDDISFLATMINKCNFNSSDIIGRIRLYDGTINECYFDCNNTLYDSSKYCLILNGSLSNISKSFFNGNTTSGVPTFLYISNVSGVSINNCNFDYNDGYAIYSNGNKGLTIDKCTFRGNAKQVNSYIYDISGEIKITKCSFLLPHIQTYPYNENAKILISNGYSKNIILLDNYYEVNFDYESETNNNSDKIQVFENEIFNKNILPSPQIANQPSELQLYNTINGLYVKGTSTSTNNIFINGSSSNTNTLFTIKAGNYKAFTNSKDVEIAIKTNDGTTRYKNNENITFNNDIDVIGIAIRLPSSTYNKNLKIMLCNI